VPSPKSHVHVLALALDGVESKLTVFVPVEMLGSVGEKVKRATSTVVVAETGTVLVVVDACPMLLVTVSVTV